MSNTATVLAFDFGASSGRAIRAVYDGQNLNYEEIHRFENIPIEKDGHLCWDVETLLKEIHTAIQKAGTFDSLGFDTWGVDFGLLDTDGHLLANPVHYRDARTNGKPEQAAARMPAEELYPVLKGAIKVYLLDQTKTIFDSWHCTIKAVNTDLDHIHILFEAPPQVQLSKLANNYKTVTSRLIRKNFSEQLKPYYWKPYFWSDSYFVCSVSDRTESAVKSYIDSQ